MFSDGLLTTRSRRSRRRRSSGSLPSEPAVHRRLCTAGKYPSASRCAGRPPRRAAERSCHARWHIRGKPPSFLYGFDRDFLPEGGNRKHLKCLHGTHLHNSALRCCVRSCIARAQQPTHPQAPHNQSPLRRGDARAGEPTDRPADCRVPRRSGEGGSPSSVREEEGPFHYRWRSAKTRSGEADLRSTVAPTLTACSKGRPERGLGCRRALRGDRDTPP